MHPRRLIPLLAVLLAACTGGGGAETVPAPRASSRLISGEEIEATQATNAYDLVQRLRPRWLVKTSTLSIRAEGDIVVYFNEQRLGGPESLRGLETGNIREIRWLDPNAATARFGINHGHGAIQVITRIGR